VSLAYNIGPGAFARSTALRRFNEGDIQGAADAMLMWNKAGGKVLRGLQRRRDAERRLFLSPVEEAPAKPSSPWAALLRALAGMFGKK
jgi:lysozyme